MAFVPTTPARMLLSQILGYISLFVSAIVTVPQVYENYINKSGESVSEIMLWIWMTADLLNFTGAFLQNIIFTAVILSAYFVLTSIVLIFQLYYYRRYSDAPKTVSSLLQNGNPELGNSNSDSVTEPLFKPTTNLAKIAAVSQYGAISDNNSSDEDTVIGQNDSSPAQDLLTSSYSWAVKYMTIGVTLGFLYYCSLILRFQPENVISITNDSPQLEFWPQLFGYISAILYAASRIPQIIKNYQSKSVEGLSLMMFVFTIISNVTFIGSFLAESTEMDRIIVNLPWILGGAISPLFDFFIFFQFYIYRK